MFLCGINVFYDSRKTKPPSEDEGSEGYTLETGGDNVYKCECSDHGSKSSSKPLPLPEPSDTR